MTYRQSAYVRTRLLIIHRLTNLAINHEPQDVWETVECQDSTIYASPLSLPIGIAILNGTADFVHELRICNGNFEVRILLVSLEAV
jgi:hypothetical protein